jgi:type IV pilus assembly protein PilO
MALNDSLEQLRNLNLSDLDFNNVGSWPGVVKGGALLIVFVITLGAGYYFLLTDKQSELERLHAQENNLKQEMTTKWDQAANLEPLRQQRDEINERFGALLRQLPSDTEVPGLLEDITLTALDNGLQIESIDLQPERRAEFYIELPMTITVQGGYHNIGSFVSGVANLSRIVTLHDFTIAPQDAPEHLRMTILAKTYRYQEAR